MKSSTSLQAQEVLGALPFSGSLESEPCRPKLKECTVVEVARVSAPRKEWCRRWRSNDFKEGMWGDVLERGNRKKGRGRPVENEDQYPESNNGRVPMLTCWPADEARMQW